MRAILRIVALIFCLIVGAVLMRAYINHNKPVVVPVDTGSVEYLFSGYVTENTGNVTGPITGNVTVTFEKQPTKLAGNYQDNGTMLRARAQNNVKTLDIPAGAKDVTIAFKLAKQSKYTSIPGSIQASVGTTKLCNGRLIGQSSMPSDDPSVYVYDLGKVYTQDHPNGADWSYAIDRTLVIKAWIGESQNYLESITVSRTL